MNRTYAFALGLLSFVVVAGGMTACEQNRRPLTAAPASMVTHAPSIAPAPPGDARSAAALKAQADDQRERGEFHQAVETYQAALRSDPTDIATRYALAQVLAQLNRRSEAIGAYTWVVQNALPGSEIARQAEQWLRDAGGSTLAGDSPNGDAASQGRLTGRLTWTDLDPNRPSPSVAIVLEGTDAITTGEIYSTRTMMNRDYDFASVKPGGYHLVAKAQMIKIWETDVVVTRGGSTVLNLDPAQAVAPADALVAKSGS
jgi:hypothetical protein